MTYFTEIYDCFLGKITDDMYLEWTKEDTLRDLQSILLNAIPEFEFPRFRLYNYELQPMLINGNALEEEQDIETPGDSETVKPLEPLEPADPEGPPTNPDNPSVKPLDPPHPEDEEVVNDMSHFEDDLTQEEMNILAVLMVNVWVQRQLTSVENIRMKYSGTDFKMTSQANHLAKLMTLKKQMEQQSIHLQRLYKRRKINSDGSIGSNWSILAESSALNDD